ncbi:MAG TPA: NAD(P)-dependent oxidoreductase [Acidimicrobiales bacterium]|nr:NAD(P)-dependent oxidoreductase [Acidimicrobiales bacterium]
MADAPRIAVLPALPRGDEAERIGRSPRPARGDGAGEHQLDTSADRQRSTVTRAGVTSPLGFALAAAVEAGGGVVVDPGDADALVWTDHADPAGLGAVLDEHPHLRWVQLPWAGVEPYVEVIRAHADRTWTCGKGVYAEPVAEHALALALAGMRGLDRYARARSWTRPRGRNLIGARVTIVGGGGIAEALLRLLDPFGCDVTVVRRTPRPMPGAARVVADADLDVALTGTDLVVLALPLLPATDRLLDARRLGLLADGACLVNVARGRHVVTDDLVAALRDGRLGSAGLDVTDPEPLPGGHPLWDLPNALVTPHTGNTPQMAVPLLTARVRDNVGRWAAGEPLVGPVDPAAGY